MKQAFLQKEACITFQMRKINLSQLAEWIWNVCNNSNRPGINWKEKHATIYTTTLLLQRTKRECPGMALWGKEVTDLCLCSGGLKEGTCPTVCVKQEIPGRSWSLWWKLSSMSALSGITTEAQSLKKALPQLGGELAGLWICYPLDSSRSQSSGG